MRFLCRFTDPAAWCFKCGVFVAAFWSILVLIIVSVTLYVEYLESTAGHDALDELSRAHFITLIISHVVLWSVGLLCTFGCMILMRRGAEAQHNIELELRQERNLAQEVSDELRRSCEDLAEKNAELARFAYTVSHDLKSPLVTIKGYIGLMLDNIHDGNYPETQQNAKTISRAADTMRQLLEELLELSRIGRVCGDYICKPLNEIVDDVLLSLDGLCEEKQPEIIIQPNMPELCGDRSRIGELVQNFVENAIKYGGGRDTPIVEITGWVENKETVCCVSDNGIGIEEAYLEKIFDLFEKLDPETPGSGVGLAIAKRIVEVHYGRIWCESSGPNQGSKFYFSIPQPSREQV